MLLSFKIALSSLSAHKLRAVLAVLGVFLGALAFTGVQHVSKAMVKKAELEVEKLGPNLFMARSGQVRFRRSSSSVGGARTFTLADADALMGSLPSAVNGSPFAQTTMDVRSGDTKIPCQLVGVWPSYEQVRSFSPQLGRFVNQEDLRLRAKVCVLGVNIAERLFGSPEAALGKDVFFFRTICTVVGVMQAKGADIVGTDQDDQVFIPLSTYLRRFTNQDWISGVYIQLAEGADPEAAKAAATAILRERHNLGEGEDDDFFTLTAKDTIELQRQALDLVGTLGMISALVSFAVGGLGVLSIMVLLVRARRLEIGVRRATGAKRGDIVRQFLLEAGFMSATGGALGTGAALALLSVAYNLGDFPAIYDPVLIATALVASSLLGLAAGAYPAYQASRLEILDILKA